MPCFCYICKEDFDIYQDNCIKLYTRTVIGGIPYIYICGNCVKGIKKADDEREKQQSLH